MARFDLNQLPLCGAMTRNGTPCKRRGNKHNGRCKLHGGNSTGPLTENGKVASRQNAGKALPLNLFGGRVNREYIIRAHNAYVQLLRLMNRQDRDWEAIHQVVAENQVPLEYAKYRLVEFNEPYALAFIQTALDCYYQDTDSAHLRFHQFEGMSMLPMFSRQLSKAQKARIDDWFRKQKLPWEKPEFNKRFTTWIKNQES